MSKKLYIETYGCQMNEADTELILGHLTGSGYSKVDSPKIADVILVNTCAVREHAEVRVLGRVSQLSGLKAQNPDLVLGLIGCMATHIKEKLLDKAPFLDIVAGPDSYRRLSQIIEEASKQPLVDVRLDKYETYSDITPRRLPGVTSWVSIMRGCNKFCTFCIVPFVRGRERCLPISDVLDQVKKSVNAGYKEIIFLGQTVNSYKYETLDFGDLLEKSAQIEGIKRIRFTSPHPIDFNEKIIRIMASYEKIMPQVHLPLQSASDKILNLMKRRYSISFYDELLHKMREAIPDLAVTTDIIVGFPQETEEDFQATFDYMQKVQYDSAFIFKYSSREGTKAYSWQETVSEKEKVERLESLVKLQTEISEKLNQKYVGKTVEVLIEGTAKKGEDKYYGKSPHFKTVVFDKNGDRPGDFVNILVEKATPHTLLGNKA